jgi:exosortase/archaeosortase family protein
VTFVGPAGYVPAGPTTTNAYLTRGGAFAAAGVLAALNAQADHIILDLSWQSPIDALLNLGGISAVIWAAMAAAWKIGGDGDRTVGGSRDLAILATVIFLSFVPISYAAQAGLLLCACYLLVTADRHNDAEQRAGIVLLALTGPLIWGRLLLRVFETPILALDARLVGAAIGSRVDGNMVRFADGSGRFIIGDPCSSVHNMSLAIVLWTTAAMLFKIRIDRRYIMIGAGMAGMMFGLNVVRLSVLGLFPAHFDYLHDGGGAVLFGWAGLIGAALLAGIGIINASARQH